jgi:hypothetical protein
MKNLTTILAVFIASVSMSFSQTENLVEYQIDAKTKVNAIRITSILNDDDKKSTVGKIESIYENTIKLRLNKNRDYTILINNGILIEIKKSDIEDYVTQQTPTFYIADNSNALRIK